MGLNWNTSYLEVLPPQPDTVVLRLADPETVAATEGERLERLLSAEERDRLRGFRSEAAAAQFLVARGLLRLALSASAPVEPTDWRFEAGPHGKPRVAAPSIARDLRFNLSHTRGLVALALCEGFEVGVDVEEVRPLDVAELAPLALAPEERSALERLAPAERTERFYALWTLKEAYAKARGFGLSLPFPEIAFEPDGDGWRLARAPQEASPATSWTFLATRQTGRHRLAVAARAPGVAIVTAGALPRAD